MEIYDISKREFKKMQQYIPNNGINNMECTLYILNNKEKWNKTYKLFKKFNNVQGKYFSNKLYIIDNLTNQIDKINIEEIIMPIDYISIDNQICGYTMPYIDNICVGKILKSQIDNKHKIKILKEIGELLEKILSKKIIYPSDIHEGNFIYNKKTKKINMVDIDSIYIDKSYPSISKYLNDNLNLYSFHKYPLNEDNIHIPNKNTIYLSYIYMILNYISGVSYISNLNMNDYYRYLQRLRDLDLSKELIDIFSKIYTECDNINPVELIETIPENIKKFNYKGIIK